MNLDGVAMDEAHISLIASTIRAAKPERILEVGVGSGRCTAALLAAIDCNQMGHVIAVDNWRDWEGVEPEHVEPLRQRGAQVMRLTEQEAIAAFASDSFQVIVSDADHHHAGEWLPEYVRVLSPGGFIFFHDTNQPNYPSLYELPNRLQRRGFACHHFTACSRQDERCGRGLLMAQKPLAQLGE